jgi:ketosteroid isomerase-like protein
MPEESTTPDLVEITRRVIEAGNRRDPHTFTSFFAPNARLDASGMGLGTFEGAAAIRAFLEDWWSSYEEYENTLDEVIHLGEGVVLAVATLVGRLPGSSGLVRLHAAWIARFADGLIVDWRAYSDIDEARAAAKRLAASNG